jgi:hypothetical protein
MSANRQASPAISRRAFLISCSYTCCPMGFAVAIAAQVTHGISDRRRLHTRTEFRATRWACGWQVQEHLLSSKSRKHSATHAQSLPPYLSKLEATASDLSPAH